MKKYLLLILLIAYFSDSFQAQNWQFVKNYMYGQKAFGTGIGSDSLGNIYVTGHTENDMGGNYFNLLWKFDSLGNSLWTKTINAGGKSITDKNGNTYIAGGSIIQKFDSTGQQIWSVLHSGEITDIAFNPMGGIQTCGFGYISDTAKSFITLLNTNGTLLWSKITEITSAALVLDCDANGNSYFAAEGYPDPYTGNSGILFKYDVNGNLVFLKTIPHTPDDIAIDSENKINITGSGSSYPFYIDSTFYYGGHFLIKFDSTGNIIWYKLFTGSLGNKNISADKKGNIYLAIAKSTLSIDTINITGVGLFVAKIDSAGNIKWYEKSNYITGGSYVSMYQGNILVRSENEVLITGGIDGVFQFGNFYSTLNYSTYDIFVAKISGQPVSLLSAAFSADKFEVCSGESIQFSDSSIGNPTSWQWFFEGGNPQSSTIQNPTVVYDQQGTYFVKLVVSDSIKSDSLIINNYITVNSLPVIDLGEDTTLPAGISLILNADSTGSAAGSFEYLWSTGDTNQTITVGASANYSVSVSNQNGCAAIDSINVLFTVAANFTSDKIQLCAGGSVGFIDSSLASPTGWNWLFEGGTPAASTVQNPTVVYSQQGTYFVKLSVSDSTSTDSLLMTSYITVFPLPLVNLGPDTILESGASIILDAENSGSQYFWNTSDTNQTITVATSGNYSVTVTNQNGCSSTDDINVLFTVSANFFADKNEICAGESVNFSDSSLGNVNSRSWVFEGGNPQNSTVQNPTVLYDQPGTYLVKLLVSDSTKSDSLIKNNYITVNALPVVDLGNDTVIPQGDSIILSATSTGSVAGDSTDLSMLFLWSNGITNHSIKVSTEGIYSVTVTSPGGCVASDEIFVGVDTNAISTNFAEKLSHSSFNIYPNPAKGSITINYFSQEPAEVRIRVLDFSGKLIHEENKVFLRQYLKTIDLSAHAKGSYFIEMVNENESRIEKIIFE